MSLLIALLQALVLFAVAPLLSGIVRVARARLHNRRGPGVLQEYRDILKLLGRQSVGPDASGWVFRLTPYVMVGVMLTIATALPVVTEQQMLSVTAASVKTGKTTPPKHFTEDTLLAAMENASKEDMPDDAERKGIGTPATRSGIIEKLVSSGFVERRKSKKITNLLPTSTGTALITVLPEQLQSPQLTAEWEHRLKEIEHGEIAPDSFMGGIAAMLNELVQTYKPIPGTEVLFPSGREAVGKCPRCGAEVTESQKGFFCENRACSFVLWKNSRFFTAKKKALTKSLAAALLKNGRAPLKGCYSEKTGKTYDAVVLLEDDGQRTGYKLVFDNG